VNLSSMFLVLNYERKYLRRSFMFNLLLFVGFLGILGFHVCCHSDWLVTKSFYPKLPAVIPYTNAYLFCLFQFFAIVFLSGDFLNRERLSLTNESLLVRPVSNAEYVLGKGLAVICLLLETDVLLVVVTMLLNGFASPSAFSPWLYLFYFATLTVPCVLVMTALVMAVKMLFVSRLVLLLLLGFVALTALVLPDLGYGLLDYTAFSVPTLFSEITGHPALGSFLLHRGFHVFGGGVLFCVAILLYRRVDERGVISRGVLRWGGVLFVLLVLAGVGYLYPFFVEGRERTTYAEVYRRYDFCPKVNVLTHDLFVELDEACLRGSSELEIENRHESRIDTLLFYLNPGLKVEELMLNGREMSFVRNHQVIIVPGGSMSPGDRARVKIRYVGRLDESVCYPEISVGEYYAPRREDYFLNPGKRSIFQDAAYTLLLPEALWYPTSLPVVNISSPFSTLEDYTLFRLCVKVQEGQLAFSQGEREVKGKETYFSFKKPKTGILLFAGKLGEEKVDTEDMEDPLLDESVTLLFNYSLDKIFLGEGMTKASREVKQYVAEDLYSDIQKIVPIKRQFRVIEVPKAFHVFMKPWRELKGYVDTECLFVEEREDKLTFARMVEQRQRMKPKADLMDLEEDVLRECLQAIARERYIFLSQKERYIGLREASPVSLPEIGIVSFDYPLMNKVIPFLGVDYTFLLSHYSFPEIKMRWDWQALCYLATGSLRKAGKDEESWPWLEDIFRLKAWQLKNYLLLSVSEESYDHFVQGFFERYRYRNVPLERFIGEVRDSLGVDLLPYLKQWNEEKGIPLFDVQDVEPSFFLTEAGWVRYLSCKVKNTAALGGIISLCSQKKVGRKVKMRVVKNVWLAPGEAVEVCWPMDTLSSKPMLQDVVNNFYQVATNLSWNIPAHFPNGTAVSLGKSEMEPRVGIREISDSLFLPPAGTIIVDNEDAGFQIRTSEHRFLRNFFENKKESYVSRLNVYNLPKRWTLCLSPVAYGKRIQSFYCKGGGGGYAELEWKANIPEAGKYALYVSLFKADFKYLSEHRYQVSQGNVVHRVSVGMPKNVGKSKIKINYADGSEQNMEHTMFGWVPIGEYELQSGEACVILQDEGLNAGDILVADAVKWVKL